MLIDELFAYLFEGQAHPLAKPMREWLDSSRRFTTFVITFRDKIRKKLRVLQEQEPLQDLRVELETAYLLLQERSLSVVYEPQLGQVRYPDFAVTFTTSLTFMVEVTRLRAVQKPGSAHAHAEARAVPSADAALTSLPVGERLADTVCSKLKQLLPQRSNILLVGVDERCPTHNELHAAMLRIQQRAERNDAALLRQHGFRDRPDFFRHYQRLSEILVRGSQLQAGDPVVAWVNPQAKHPLPGRVRNALYHSHRV